MKLKAKVAVLMIAVLITIMGFNMIASFCYYGV